MDYNKINQNWFDNIEARPHPWPGLNWLTPSLSVDDVKKSIVFYSVALNFVSIFELPDSDGELLFARMRYRGCNFILNKNGWNADTVLPAANNVATNFYLYVDDVISVFNKMKEEGARDILSPHEAFWGDLMARLQDPFGYVWDIGQKII